MSRSRKKRPYGNYHCLTGQKEAKRIGNRNLRRICKQILHIRGETDPDLIFPTMDEVCNVWSMPMDGKQYYMPLDIEKAEERWGNYTPVVLYGKPAWYIHYKFVLAK